MTLLSELSNVEIILCDIHSFAFHSLSYYLNLRNVPTLTLHFVHNIYDISRFKNVHNLTLMNGTITNVDALKNVHTLHLHSLNVRNVNELCHVNTLTLSSLYYVFDVSNLGTVPNLTIINCPNITTDINSLKTVRNLTIINCPNII